RPRPPPSTPPDRVLRLGGGRGRARRRVHGAGGAAGLLERRRVPSRAGPRDAPPRPPRRRVGGPAPTGPRPRPPAPARRAHRPPGPGPRQAPGATVECSRAPPRRRPPRRARVLAAPPPLRAGP